MSLIDLILITGLIWAAILILDIIQYLNYCPGLLGKIATKIFTSFWLSTIIHMSFFITMYCALAYYVIGMSSIFAVENTIMWITGGIVGSSSLILVIRIRTDQLFLIRKWIIEGLRESGNTEEYVNALLEKLSIDVNSKSSQKLLIVLRELSLKGDQNGSIIWKRLNETGMI